MSSINKKNKMNKNSDNKIKLTFHPAEFGAKMLFRWQSKA